MNMNRPLIKFKTDDHSIPFMTTFRADPWAMSSIGPLKSPNILMKAFARLGLSSAERAATTQHDTRNETISPSHDQDMTHAVAATASANANTSAIKVASTFNVTVAGAAFISTSQTAQPEGRGKRWKKPAKKRTRRFGFEIASNDAGYFPTSDEESDGEKEVWKDTEENVVLSTWKKRNTDAGPIKKRTKRPNVTLTKRPTLKEDAGSPNKKTKKAVKKKAKKITKKVAKKTSKKVAKKTSKKRKKKKANRPDQRHLKVTSFEIRMKHLKEFKDKFGHCHVPYTYDPNQSLANWCSNVRYSNNILLKGGTPTIKLTDERLQALHKIGFYFGSPVKKENEATETLRPNHHVSGNDAERDATRSDTQTENALENVTKNPTRRSTRACSRRTTF